MTGSRTRWLAALLTACLTACVPAHSTASDGQEPVRAPQEHATQVWFAPADDSADYLDLFRSPEKWAVARQVVDVFEFNTDHLQTNSPNTENTITNLAAVDAFRKLASWEIKIAVQGFHPSPLKNPDGSCARGEVVQHYGFRLNQQVIDNVTKAMGTVDLMTMNEPVMQNFSEYSYLQWGTADPRECLYSSLDELAVDYAGHIKLLRLANPDLVIGQVELYPEVMPEHWEAWVVALETRGVKPAFLHLDYHHDRVVAYQKLGLPVDPTVDIPRIRAMCKEHDIAFGPIVIDHIWQHYVRQGPDGKFEHDPSYTDAVYCRNGMEWVSILKPILGGSWTDHVKFQSWACGPGLLQTIPRNLPDTAMDSHTRFMLDALRVLAP